MITNASHAVPSFLIYHIICTHAWFCIKNCPILANNQVWLLSNFSTSWVFFSFRNALSMTILISCTQEWVSVHGVGTLSFHSLIYLMWQWRVLFVYYQCKICIHDWILVEFHAHDSEMCLLSSTLDISTIKMCYFDNKEK